MGRGPGEFEDIAWAGMCNDSLLHVWDPILRRLSVVDERGSIRVLPTPFEGVGRVYRVRCGKGKMILMSWPTLDPATPPGPWRSNVGLYLADDRGMNVRRIGTVSGPDRLRFAKTDGPRPLGRQPHFAIGQDWAYVNTGDDQAIQRISLDGGVSDTIGPREPGRRRTPGDIAIFLDSVAGPGASRERRQDAARFYADHQYPARIPAYKGMLVGPDDNVYVEEYPQVDRPGRWLGFSNGTRPRVIIEVPRGFSLHQLGRDWVLGIVWTPEGEPIIREFPLVRQR